jgi:hypothetical protein
VDRKGEADAAKLRADKLREDADAARDRAAEHRRGTDEHLERGVNRDGLNDESGRPR